MDYKKLIADICEMGSKKHPIEHVIGSTLGDAERALNSTYIEGCEDMLKKLYPRIEELERENEWQPLTDENLPPSRKTVQVAYLKALGKIRITNAWYAHKFEVEADFDNDGDWHEYSEEKDEYYLPEGWYERAWEGETDYYINDKILFIRPMPTFPEHLLTPLTSKNRI